VFFVFGFSYCGPFLRGHGMNKTFCCTPRLSLLVVVAGLLRHFADLSVNYAAFRNDFNQLPVASDVQGSMTSPLSSPNERRTLIEIVRSTLLGRYNLSDRFKKTPRFPQNPLSGDKELICQVITSSPPRTVCLQHPSSTALNGLRVIELVPPDTFCNSRSFPPF